AAGLTSSSVEMAGRSGCGVAIDLTLVPTRAAAMQPWELLLSESQERMLAAVIPAKLDKVREVLETFNLAFAVIGKVNHTGKFTCTFYDELFVNMPVGILVDDTPKYQWP